MINGFCGLHAQVIYQEMLLISICKMQLKIALLRLLLLLPGDNVLRYELHQTIIHSVDLMLGEIILFWEAIFTVINSLGNQKLQL